MMAVLIDRPIRRSATIAFGSPIFPAGGGEEANGPYPAPAGWRWGTIRENGNTMTDGAVPLVELKRIA